MVDSASPRPPPAETLSVPSSGQRSPSSHPFLPGLEPPAPLVFDLETQRSASEVGGWHNTHRMGLAVGVLYDCATDVFESYAEARVEALVERLLSAPVVIGFNVRRFDYGVLRGYTERRLDEIRTFDLLEDVHARLGYRLGLDHLAEHTLGRHKTASGLQSLEWFRRGEIAKVEAYCRADVEITRDLWLHGAREGYVDFLDRRTNRRTRLPVDWGHETILARATGRGEPRR